MPRIIPKPALQKFAQPALFMDNARPCECVQGGSAYTSRTEPIARKENENRHPPKLQ